MITAEQVMPLLLQASPSFDDEWRELEHDPVRGGLDGEPRLHYLDASAFASHLIRQWVAGNLGEVRAALGVIERLHLEGDAYVRELATIGYLEGIQNELRRGTTDFQAFSDLLGSESARLWRGLDEFWNGRTQTVLPMEGE